MFFFQSAFLLADDFSNRLTDFSAIESSSGSFVETWNAEYLDEPLISKGNLRYRRPSQLSKFITEPVHIEQHIKDGRLSVLHNGKTHTVHLSEQIELAASIYALQSVLDGDAEKLQTLFIPQYNELDDHWNLKLSPIDKQVADSIELIKLQGTGNQIQKVFIQFSNGDSLLTEISHGE